MLRFDDKKIQIWRAQSLLFLRYLRPSPSGELTKLKTKIQYFFVDSDALSGPLEELYFIP